MTRYCNDGDYESLSENPNAWLSIPVIPRSITKKERNVCEKFVHVGLCDKSNIKAECNEQSSFHEKQCSSQQANIEVKTEKDVESKLLSSGVNLNQINTHCLPQNNQCFPKSIHVKTSISENSPIHDNNIHIVDPICRPNYRPSDEFYELSKFSHMKEEPTVFESRAETCVPDIFNVELPVHENNGSRRDSFNHTEYMNEEKLTVENCETGEIITLTEWPTNTDNMVSLTQNWPCSSPATSDQEIVGLRCQPFTRHDEESSENTFIDHSSQDGVIIQESSRRRSQQSVTLSLAEKVKAIEMYDELNSCRKVSKILGVGKTQITGIMKRRAEILRAYKMNASNYERRKKYATKNEEINQLTADWVSSEASNGVHVSGGRIKQRALEFANRLGIDTFRASNGWLENFRKRKAREIYDVAYKSTVDDECGKFSKICADVELREIVDGVENGSYVVEPLHVENTRNGKTTDSAREIKYTLSLSEKVKAIELYDELKSYRKVSEIMGVGKTQILRTVRRKADILRAYKSNASSYEKRKMRITGNEEINRLTRRWLSDTTAVDGSRISGSRIQSRALKFAKQLGNETFRASNGWLASFLRRYKSALDEPNEIRDEDAILTKICASAESRENIDRCNSGLDVERLNAKNTGNVPIIDSDCDENKSKKLVTCDTSDSNLTAMSVCSLQQAKDMSNLAPTSMGPLRQAKDTTNLAPTSMGPLQQAKDMTNLAPTSMGPLQQANDMTNLAPTSMGPLQQATDTSSLSATSKCSLQHAKNISNLAPTSICSLQQAKDMTNLAPTSMGPLQQAKDMKNFAPTSMGPLQLATDTSSLSATSKCSLQHAKDISNLAPTSICSLLQAKDMSNRAASSICSLQQAKDMLEKLKEFAIISADPVLLGHIINASDRADTLDTYNTCIRNDIDTYSDTYAIKSHKQLSIHNLFKEHDPYCQPLMSRALQNTLYC